MREFKKGSYYFLATLENRGKIQDLLSVVLYGPGVPVPLEFIDVGYECVEMVSDKREGLAGSFELKEYIVTDILNSSVTLITAAKLEDMFTAIQSKESYDELCKND